MKWILIIYSVWATIRLISYKAAVEALCEYVVDHYDLDDFEQEDLEEYMREVIRSWFERWAFKFLKEVLCGKAY